MGKKFKAARRHSLRVRLLRIAMPIALVAIVGGVVGLTYFNPARLLTRLPLDPGKVTISGTKVTMAAPRLAGFTNDQRAYELTARAASQDVTQPNFLELQDITAKVELQDKAVVELKAANGLYDRKTEQLTLLDKILLKSTTGYEAHLTQAVVDVKGGNVVSSKPVEVKMLNGTLNANRLEVADKGEVARFEGGVVMILNLDTPRDTKAKR
ncbi:MAG TPA: LPS export ABC transporter periplasmic protein LptC [Xanthobacteraceae bacterium]|nr:LPS export ABC transporter periplasmic protein LptC [Xanthobacteraceae bacterium]